MPPVSGPVEQPDPAWFATGAKRAKLSASNNAQAVVSRSRGSDL